MSYEVALRILEMLGSADVYDDGLGATLSVKIPEPEGRLITSPIKPPGDPIQVIGAAGRLIRHAAELGAFDAPPPGIPFDFTVDGPLTMPAVPSGPRPIAWSIVVVRDRAFAACLPMEGPAEYQLRTLAEHSVSFVSYQICSIAPKIIADIYLPAACRASSAALREWQGGGEWAVGAGGVDAHKGWVVVGIATPRFWTGEIWLGEILAGRGDGRGA